VSEAARGLIVGRSTSIVDMHVHTSPTSSDSMLDPHDLVRVAVDNGLTGVNISDHDQMLERHAIARFREQYEAPFVNFGMEVSTDLGHMIAVGLREYLPGIRRAAQLRLELERVGGFLIVAHPFRHLFESVTAMRTGKTFDMTPEQAAETMPVFKIVHGIEIANGANTPGENEFAAEVARLLGLVGTGGSDAHSTSGVGAFSTGFDRVIDSEVALLEELHAGRCEAVHRTRAGRWVRFAPGSTAAAALEVAEA
jgi:predicted metal-dependent phosphoesterase TrpH